MEEFPVIKANHFKILTILTIITSLCLGVYVYSAKEVTIFLDDDTIEILSYKNTLGELLEKENIVLDEDAYIDTPLDTPLEDNMNIVIRTPKPYTLIVGDSKSEIKSAHVKVKDILEDGNIKLGEEDYTYPKLEDAALDGRIQVFKVKEITEETQEVIPYESIVNNSNRLDIGTVNILQEGKDGLKNIKIKKVFEDDKLVSEDIIEEEIIEKPIPKIVEKGTKNRLATSRGGARYKKAITMTATAYDLSYESCGKKPGDRYYGITASGTKAKVGTVAVDPRIIPLGTKLYVESLDGTKDYGFSVAEDTGGAIKNNRIDLFFNTNEEVKRFGRRKVKVYILE